MLYNYGCHSFLVANGIAEAGQGRVHALPPWQSGSFQPSLQRRGDSSQAAENTRNMPYRPLSAPNRVVFGGDSCDRGVGDSADTGVLNSSVMSLRLRCHQGMATQQLVAVNFFPKLSFAVCETDLILSSLLTVSACTAQWRNYAAVLELGLCGSLLLKHTNLEITLTQFCQWRSYRSGHTLLWW